MVNEELGEDSTTRRGFSLVSFDDANGHKCSLQQSSLIGDSDREMDNPGSSYVWLGVDDPEPVIMKTIARALGMQLPPGEVSGWMPYPIPEEVQFTTRMHLDRQQVIGLIQRLDCWLRTGSFADGAGVQSAGETE
jgi:hypothetical protein